MLRPPALLVLLALTASASARQRTEADPGSRLPDSLVLLVVDRGGKPLPDAEVRIAIEDDGPGSVRDDSVPGGRRQTFRLDHAPASELVDALLRHSPVVQPSASGELRCSWPRDRGLLVAASHGELWGFRWFPRDWRETTGRAHPEGAPLRLALVPDWPLVVRVVDDAGRPLGSASLRLRCGSWTRGLTSQGELRFPHVGHDLRDQSEPLVVALDALLSPPVQQVLDPRRPPPGPVVLRLPASGSVRVQVLEPDDQPARKACWVELRLVPDPVPESSRRFEARVDRASVRALAVQGTVKVDGVSLGRELGISLGEGEGSPETRIRGPVSPGETVEVTLHREARPAPAEPFEPWTGIVSEPAPCGDLDGFVLLDPAVPPEELEVRVQPRGGTANCTYATSLGRDGKFGLAVLPPGPARFEIYSRAVREPVFALELDIKPGANADPRVAAIDLRGKLSVHVISLKGLDPERAFHARAYFQPAGTWMPMPAYLRAWEHPLVLVSPWRSIDVELFVPGHRSVALHALAGRTEVELEPALPVRLLLGTDGALPAPPRRLKAVLAPTERPGIGIDWEGPAFGPEREIRTYAWGPGRMQVLWIVAEYADDLSRGSGRVAEVFPPQYVDVLETAGEQVFELPIPAEELARILAE